MQAQTSPLPIAGVLDADVACLNCGYNLRGINPAGTCPECGMRIAVALREDRLSLAPASWCRDLRRGATLLLAGTVMSLPLVSVGPAIAGVGYWLITRREPGRDEPRHDTLVRIFSRGTMTPGALGLCLILNVLAWVTWRHRFDGSFDWMAYDSLLIGFAGYFGIGVAAMAQYLRTLAERTDDTALVSRSRRLFWVWIMGGLIVVTLGLVTNLYSYVGRPWAQYQLWYAGAAMVVVLLLAVWLWAATLRVVMRFWRMTRTLDTTDVAH